jgi:hypothetical protein
MFLLVNSIPLTASACKASAHLCPWALEAASCPLTENPNKPGTATVPLESSGKTEQCQGPILRVRETWGEEGRSISLVWFVWFLSFMRAKKEIHLTSEIDETNQNNQIDQ